MPDTALPAWKTACLALAFWVSCGGPLLTLGAWDGRTQRTRDACAAGAVILGIGAYLLAWVLANGRHR